VNINREEFDEPVELPEGVHHGGSTGYVGHSCRCRHCVTWSRMYAQIRYYKAHNERLKRRREAQDYLMLRGVYLAGPGPFKRVPTKLARLVADFLGDDLDQWLEGKGRSTR
jgi:hypothetical protein